MADYQTNNIAESRRKEFTAIESDLSKWLAAYNGGRSYAAQVIHSHRLEPAGDLAERIKCAAPLNYLRPICDTYANYLFRPSWGMSLPAEIAELETDADRKGTSCVDLFKKAEPIAAAAGYCLIGVDEPTQDDPNMPRNMAERKALGIRPYLYIIGPTNMVDWETDDDGQLTFALLREEGSNRQFDGYKIVDKSAVMYRLWTPELCNVYDKDGKMISTIPNRAGVVPIVSLQFRNIDHAIIGAGLGVDLEPIQARILNIQSQLDEIFCRQTFSQMYAPGDPIEYGEVQINDKGETVAIPIQRLGTKAILPVPNDAKFPPGFISPDASQARLLMDEMQNAVKEIYRLAQLKRGSVDSATVQSGVSKAFDFVDTNQALADVAKNTAEAMRNALTIACKWVGTNGVAEVTPPTNFGISDISDEAQTLLTLQQAQAPMELIEEQSVRVWLAMNPDKTESDAPQMVAEPMSQPTNNEGTF